MANLVLLRHGQSLWNAANRFTGWVDVPLSRRGRVEATLAAHKLRDYRICVCFTSMLVRALETAIICLTECPEICGDRTPIVKHARDNPYWHGWDEYDGDPQAELPIYPNAALDERYYGDLQGSNKADTAERVGADRVRQWRQSVSARPPGGESLADTRKRVSAFFQDCVLTHVRQGDNVLVAAHRNSLRAVVMELERMNAEDVSKLQIDTGVPIVYEINTDGSIASKAVLSD